MTRENGFALVLTLLITALLVALAVEFVHEVYVETALGRSSTDAQQASLMADSGVHIGMKLLEDCLSGQEFASLHDRWAAPLEQEDEKGKLRVDIVDENGKFNLNSIVFPNGVTDQAAYDGARRLFRALRLPVALCDSIADWIDTDGEARANGAETPYYRSLSTPYLARDGRLETFDELRMVKDCDESTLRTLGPHATVLSDESGITSGRINVNTASREVLAAMDENMTDELAGRILAYRKTSPIRSPAEVSRIAGLETIGIRLQGRMSVKGFVYRIISRATVNGTTRTIEALVRVNGAEPSILYWRET